MGTPGGDVLAPGQLFDPRNGELAALLDGASLFPGPAFASRPEVRSVLPRASGLPLVGNRLRSLCRLDSCASAISWQHSTVERLQRRSDLHPVPRRVY